MATTLYLARPSPSILSMSLRGLQEVPTRPQQVHVSGACDPVAL